MSRNFSARNAIRGDREISILGLCQSLLQRTGGGDQRLRYRKASAVGNAVQCVSIGIGETARFPESSSDEKKRAAAFVNVAAIAIGKRGIAVRLNTSSECSHGEESACTACQERQAF